MNEKKNNVEKPTIFQRVVMLKMCNFSLELLTSDEMTDVVVFFLYLLVFYKQNK